MMLINEMSRQGWSGLFELFFMQCNGIKKASSDSPLLCRRPNRFFLNTKHVF
jgi:hypothetical protein